MIEADESDGSLVRYAPWAGVVLNLGLDHKEPAVIMEMFRTFAGRAGRLVVGADERLDELGGDRFGAYRLEVILDVYRDSRFRKVDQVPH